MKPVISAATLLVTTALWSISLEAKESLAEAPVSTIGYDSVAEASEDLHSQSDVAWEDQNGWAIAVDRASYTIWSFAPRDNAAYPAVVKRQVVRDGAISRVNVDILCEASKEACDELVRTFSDMTARTLPQ